MLRKDMRQKIEDYIRDDVIIGAKWKRDGVCKDMILGIQYSERQNLDEIKEILQKKIGRNLYFFILEGGDGLEALIRPGYLPFGSLKKILLSCKERIDTERTKKMHFSFFFVFVL